MWWQAARGKRVGGVVIVFAIESGREAPAGVVLVLFCTAVAVEEDRGVDEGTDEGESGFEYCGK